MSVKYVLAMTIVMMLAIQIIADPQISSVQSNLKKNNKTAQKTQKGAQNIREEGVSVLIDERYKLKASQNDQTYVQNLQCYSTNANGEPRMWATKMTYHPRLGWSYHGVAGLPNHACSLAL